MEDGEIEGERATEAMMTTMMMRPAVETVGAEGTARASSSTSSSDYETPRDYQENEEVRNILRQPRYFDDDYEAAALRCFRCGQGGHREAECELPAKKKPCHLCGYKSHVARDCPHGLCYNCLTPGHQSRDCPYVRGSGRDAQALCCLRCVKSGHVVADCVYRFDANDLAQIHCYVCGSIGHLCCAPQDALPPGVPTCCRCGGNGHLDLACAHARRGFGGGSAPEFSCFHCGERGHIARECPKKDDGDNVRPSGNLSRAPQTFHMGSVGTWRGPGGGRAGGRGGGAAASRGYAAKYGGNNNRRQTNTGTNWQGGGGAERGIGGGWSGRGGGDGFAGGFPRPQGQRKRW